MKLVELFHIIFYGADGESSTEGLASSGENARRIAREMIKRAAIDLELEDVQSLLDKVQEWDGKRSLRPGGWGAFYDETGQFGFVIKKVIAEIEHDDWENA